MQNLARALGVNVSEFSAEDAVGVPEKGLPPGLAGFLRERSKILGVRKTDIDVMKGVHYRGKRPRNPEDWELLFLFLKKWVK